MVREHECWQVCSSPQLPPAPTSTIMLEMFDFSIKTSSRAKSNYTPRCDPTASRFSRSAVIERRTSCDEMRRGTTTRPSSAFKKRSSETLMGYEMILGIQSIRVRQSYLKYCTNISGFVTSSLKASASTAPAANISDVNAGKCHSCIHTGMFCPVSRSKQSTFLRRIALKTCSTW